MPRSILFLVFLVSTLNLVHAQDQPTAKPQTARQALLEILTGDENAISKHMTVEVQQSLKAGKGQSGMMAMGTVSSLREMGLNRANREVFDTGPILFAMNEPKTHERVEIHVEGDDLAGEEDTLQLSVHAFRDGQEIDTPMRVVSQIQVDMKKQESVWRMNAITVSVVLPVGDPKLMERLEKGVEGGGMFGGKIGAAPAATAERPKLDTRTTLSMLAVLEGTFAQSHPESGFTCSLSDLIDNSKRMAEALQIDPAVATGVLDGYKFTLSGCQGSPAATFQITAEPVSAATGNKAFCTDATHNVRVSNDGRGSTCLSSGKVERGQGNAALLPESHTEIVLP